MTMRHESESERRMASEAETVENAEGHVAADPEAEEDNSLKSETSSTLLYLGIGIPLILFLSTGVFGAINGYPGFAVIGFGVSALLVALAVFLVVKLVRANRGRSHH